MDMAVRCSLEIDFYRQEYDLPSSFITLTYNDKHLPKDGSLNYRHFQLFMKKYREWLDRKGYGSVKFYMCGEYGKKLQRPHYHAIIFGHMFSDLTRVSKLEHGHVVYTSPVLEGLWQKGYVTVGEASTASARYVASYIHKKLNGPIADDHYKGKRPEFTNGSKRPAIGYEWLKKYHRDIVNYDEFVVNGSRLPVPEYFNKKLKEMFPEEMEIIVQKRMLNGVLRLEEKLLNGESDLANRARNGTFTEILHSIRHRRIYESGEIV